MEKREERCIIRSHRECSSYCISLYSHLYIIAMKVLQYPDYESLSEFAADEIIRVIEKKTNALICFASGDSPKRTCELFVQKVKEKNLDLSQCSFVALDEWVGLAPDLKGSCHYDFMHRLADPLGLQPYQFNLFDGLADHLSLECSIMDEWIDERGRIDIMIVGIGMNGHIGFNEPDVDLDLRSHVIPLDETTMQVGQKYFDQKVSLSHGITLGLSYLISAIKVLIVANGIKKSKVIQLAVEGPLTSSFPASIIQIHPEGYILVDHAAGSLLPTASS